jgi:hypothetical protein
MLRSRDRDHRLAAGASSIALEMRLFIGMSAGLRIAHIYISCTDSL